jgi:hypothetical protein
MSDETLQPVTREQLAEGLRYLVGLSQQAKFEFSLQESAQVQDNIGRIVRLIQQLQEELQDAAKAAEVQAEYAGKVLEKAAERDIRVASELVGGADSIEEATDE